jgi:hypothetical protein
MHLIRPEHLRRVAAGEEHASLSDEAAHLAAWLAKAYPHAPPPTSKTVANAIRGKHPKRQAACPK